MTTEDQVFHALLRENGLFRELKTTVVLVSSSGISSTCPPPN